VKDFLPARIGEDAPEYKFRIVHEIFSVSDPTQLIPKSICTDDDDGEA